MASAPFEFVDQVRSYSISKINTLAIKRTKYVRREASSIGELNQVITHTEWSKTEGIRAGCKLDIFELDALLECTIADIIEFFVADDTLEGGAGGERPVFNDFELIGESDTREGVASCECPLA